MSQEEVDAVRAAVLDYVEGMYYMEPERIERSVHKDMAKRGFARQPYVELHMKQEGLLKIARTGLHNDGKKVLSEEKTVVVYEVLDQTASAKLTACWGIDFMHLAKYDGKWKVVNVMWQSHPPGTKRDKLQLVYWKIRGLGSPLRMMFRYAGVEYEDKQLECVVKDDGSFDDGIWYDVEKPKMLADNPMINLPNIRAGDLLVTQSNGCAQFLGRRLGLCGSSEKEISSNEQVMCQVFDLRNDFIRFAYPNYTTKEQFPEEIRAHFEDKAPRHYKKLEGWLSKYGTSYFSGESPLTADFQAFEMLDQHEIVASRMSFASPMAGYPKLQEFHKRFLSLPQLQEYFSGPDHKLPVNDKMAHVGSD
mmetsp:Transcript_38991/g.70974  ORF Transcript_38991/g.70974 Transcript_38991/m.70974 type:complete len:362 (-) Transcript_38991:192-1277(-)